MTIEVVEHSPQWSKLFTIEEKHIESILGECLIATHHIGSTSVSSLMAKPIIDILLIVRDIEEIDSYDSGFEALGYECMGEFGIANRRYFRKGGEHRSHHIHAFDIHSSHEITRHLAFRDYLRSHPDVRDAYGALKSKLALAFRHDNDGYCDGKDEFVKQTERDALIWYFSR